jgi:hypothetical protein
MSRPCLYSFRCGFSQSTLFLNRADKPQVSALNENRGKFVKKPNDLIRRKFSIDAISAIGSVAAVVSTISKPYRFRLRKLGIHHPRRMRSPNGAKPASYARSFVLRAGL